MYSFQTLLALAVTGSFVQQETSGVSLSPVIIRNVSDGICPSTEVINAAHNEILQEVRALLQSTVIPALSCPCGGHGDWTRIAFLNMSDPSVQCPPNWRLSTTNLTIRGCGRSTDTGPSCDSAIFPSNGRSYSRVCGRIVGYQCGTPDAFFNFNRPNATLENSYLDGVSVTHGLAGSRQHIWSFAAGLNKVEDRIANCPCVVPNINNSQVIPTFVEGSYFCESGNPLPGELQFIFFSDDPLWDGEGCSSSSTCCQLNNPPYFCTTLPQVTTDAIELRICLDQFTEDEDIIVNLVDIYVM